MSTRKTRLLTAAAKVQMISELLDTNVYADDGITVVDKKRPIISKKQALSLLDGSFQRPKKRTKKK